MLLPLLICIGTTFRAAAKAEVALRSPLRRRLRPVLRARRPLYSQGVWPCPVLPRQNHLR